MLNNPAGHRLTLAKPLTQSSHRLTKRCDGVHVRFEEGGPAWGSGGVATLVVRAFGCRLRGHYKSEGASIRPEGDRLIGEAPSAVPRLDSRERTQSKQR